MVGAYRLGTSGSGNRIARRRGEETGISHSRLAGARHHDRGISLPGKGISSGKPVKALTTAAAQLLIDLIDQQRGITLRTEVNWTSLMRTAAIDHKGSHQQRLQSHGGLLLDVLIAARELAAAHAHCEPPDTEMVHGDLSMSNVLVRDGVVTGAVDIEAIGRGCAVFDLLTPVRQGHRYGAEVDALELLETTALSVLAPDRSRSQQPLTPSTSSASGSTSGPTASTMPP